MKTTSNQRRHRIKDDLKVLKVEYLSNFRSDPPQILNLSLGDQIKIKVDKEIERAINDKMDIPKNRFISDNSDNAMDCKCKLCEESFDKFVDLENHIEECHEKHNVFQCDKCEKGVVLKWRLNKHMQLHAETNIKPCHYFNNGCKFYHTVA